MYFIGINQIIWQGNLPCSVAETWYYLGQDTFGEFPAHAATVRSKTQASKSYYSKPVPKADISTVC